MKEWEERAERENGEMRSGVDVGGAREERAPEMDGNEGAVDERSRREGRLVRFMTRRRILLLLKGIGLLVLAFLFGRCEWILSVKPFGIALLCAAESGLFWIYCGVFLSALPILGGVFRPIAVVIATAAVLLRVAARMTLDLPWKRGDEPDVHGFGTFCRALFREHIVLRVAVGSVASFLTGLYRMIGGGYRVYDLLSSLLLMVTVPLSVCLLSGLWQRDVLRLDRFSRIATASGVLGMLTLSLSGLSFYGISLSVFTALGATLWMTHRRGISYGILLGLLLGLLIDPVSAPLYAFSALLSGALRRVSVFMGALSALSVGMAWGFYVYGLGALSVLFPSLLSSALLFCVLERLHLLPGEADGGGTPTDGSDTALPKRGESSAEMQVNTVFADAEEPDRLAALRSALAEERLRDEEKRIEEICGAFLSVSDLFRALTESSKYPSVEEFRRVCDRVCDEFCPGCGSCAQCWGSEYARMAGTLGHMADELHRKGSVGEDAFPEEVLSRCKMSGAILYRINEEAGELTASYLKREKAGLLSADYSAAAALFRSASSSGPDRYEIDAGRSRSAEAFLLENGICATRVAASGGQRGMLYAWGVDRKAIEEMLSEDEGRRAFLDAVGFLPGVPILTPIPGGGGLYDVRIPAVPRYRVQRAYALRPARRSGREEGLCGDSIALFEGADGKFFALLSDGMGSGRKAAQLSGICSVFLQKMLLTGGEIGVILRMLNDFLSAGAIGEISATVDLLELDLYTGEGIFWKSGAAPSFVLREGNLFLLNSRTAPIGILSEADVQKIAFRFYPGDTVVMLSDGVVDDGEDPSFLEMLVGDAEGEGELKRAAERIVDRRRAATAGKPEDLDDRSVILLSVEEVREEIESGLETRAAC